MFWSSLAATGYFVIALIFFVFTYREGLRRLPVWDVHRCIGLAASVLWPVAVAYVWIACTRQPSDAAASCR